MPCKFSINFERDEEMTQEKTEEQISKEVVDADYPMDRYMGEEEEDLLEIQAIMEEVEHDPEVRQAMEEAQREYGTLTPEELRRQFTI